MKKAVYNALSYTFSFFNAALNSVEFNKHSLIRFEVDDIVNTKMRKSQWWNG
jgi:hypothetical protein